MSMSVLRETNFLYFFFVILVAFQAQLITAKFTTIDDPYIPPNKTSGYHRALLQEFVEVFAGDDAEKKNVLLFSTIEMIQPSGTNNECYRKIFEVFKSFCIYYYYQLKSVDPFKSLFEQICETKWLETEVIAKMVRNTCLEKPYLRH